VSLANAGTSKEQPTSPATSEASSSSWCECDALAPRECEESKSMQVPRQPYCTSLSNHLESAARERHRALTFFGAEIFRSIGVQKGTDWRLLQESTQGGQNMERARRRNAKWLGKTSNACDNGHAPSSHVTFVLGGLCRGSFDVASRLPHTHTTHSRRKHKHTHNRSNVPQTRGRRY